MSSFIAGKPAPTGINVEHKICVHWRSTVGAGLPAMRPLQAPNHLLDGVVVSPIQNRGEWFYARCAAERRLRQLLQKHGARGTCSSCRRLRSAAQQSSAITANTHPTADNHERVQPDPLVSDWRLHTEQAPSRLLPGESHDRNTPSAITVLAVLKLD